MSVPASRRDADISTTVDKRRPVGGAVPKKNGDSAGFVKLGGIRWWVHGAMVLGVSQPGAPLRPSRAARWTLSTEGQGLPLRNFEGRVSDCKSGSICKTRTCARRINASRFYGLRVIAQPLFDCVDTKPPVVANAKPRQFSLSEQPVNCGFMNVEIFRQVRDG